MDRLSSAGRSWRRLTERRLSRARRLAGRQLDGRAARRQLAAIVEQLNRSSPEPQRATVLSRRVTAGGVVLAEVGPHADQESGALVKLSRRAAQRLNLRREARLLRLVHGHPGLAQLTPLVPLPLLSGEHDGWSYLVESRLPGRSPEGPAGQRAVTEALEVIARLHHGTACPTTVDERLLRRWISNRARVVTQLLGSGLDAGGQQALARLEAELRASLADRRLSIGWIHGDYWPANILLSGGTIAGVVDWDSLGSRELPLHDRLHYVVTVRRLSAGQQWGRTLADMLRGARDPVEGLAIPDSPEEEAIDRRTSLLLYWLRGVQLNLRRHPSSTARAGWLEANVSPVLEAIA